MDSADRHQNPVIDAVQFAQRHAGAISAAYAAGVAAGMVRPVVIVLDRDCKRAQRLTKWLSREPEVLSTPNATGNAPSVFVAPFAFVRQWLHMLREPDVADDMESPPGDGRAKAIVFVQGAAVPMNADV